MEEAARTLVEGRDRRIDVGVVRFGDDLPEPESSRAAKDRPAQVAEDEEVFLVMAGLGLDGQIMADTNETAKEALGWVAYVLAAGKKLSGRGFTVDVRATGEGVIGSSGRSVARRARAVIVGNCGLLQGGVQLMPEAVLDDGRLDAVVLAPQEALGWASVVADVVTTGGPRLRSGLRRPDHPLAFIVRKKFRPVIELDERLIVAATDITRADPGLRSTLLGWQEATEPKWVYIVASAVCLVLWRRHRDLRSRCRWAFVTMMVAWNQQLVLKEVVRRARPIVSDPVSHAPGYGFPSGHVANAAAIATVMTLLLWPLLSPVSRRWLMGALMAYVALTALDRVFLGVHFPADVVARILFGLGLGTASYLGYLGWNPQGPDDSPPPEGDAGPESPKGST